MTDEAPPRIPHPVMRERLVALFPNAIAGKGVAKKPLARHVHRQIEAVCPDVPAFRIRRWMNWYTDKPSYLRALQAPDAMRHDLDGNPVDPVTDAHKRNAAFRLERSIRRRAEREARNQARRQEAAQ